MTKITFIEQDGTSHTVNAQKGQSLMEVAVSNMIPGIDADCGGACACATCHIYVEAEWQDKLKPKAKIETEMLEFANNLQANSRLSCQIAVDVILDGLIVSRPARVLLSF